MLNSNLITLVGKLYVLFYVNYFFVIPNIYIYIFTRNHKHIIMIMRFHRYTSDLRPYLHISLFQHASSKSQSHVSHSTLCEYIFISKPPWPQSMWWMPSAQPLPMWWMPSGQPWSMWCLPSGQPWSMWCLPSAYPWSMWWMILTQPPSMFWMPSAQPRQMSWMPSAPPLIWSHEYYWLRICFTAMSFPVVYHNTCYMISTIKITRLICIWYIRKANNNIISLCTWIVLFTSAVSMRLCTTPHMSVPHLICLYHTSYVCSTPHMSVPHLICLYHTSYVRTTPHMSVPHLICL